MFTNCICKYTFFTSLLNLYQVLIYLNFTAVPHGRLEPTRTRVPFRMTTRSAIILDTYIYIHMERLNDSGQINYRDDLYPSTFTGPPVDFTFAHVLNL